MTIDVRGKLTLDNATMKKAVVTEAGTGTWAAEADNQDKLTLVATKDVDVINSPFLVEASIYSKLLLDGKLFFLSNKNTAYPGD